MHHAELAVDALLDQAAILQHLKMALIAGAEMRNWALRSAPTVRSPYESRRSTIARRVGSASAGRTWSRLGARAGDMRASVN